MSNVGNFRSTMPKRERIAAMRCGSPLVASTTFWAASGAASDASKQLDAMIRLAHLAVARRRVVTRASLAAHGGVCLRWWRDRRRHREHEAVRIDDAEDALSPRHVGRL